MGDRAAAGAVTDVVANPGMQGPGAERAERDVLAASTMPMTQQDVGAISAGLAADSQALVASRFLLSRPNHERRLQLFQRRQGDVPERSVKAEVDL